MKLTLSPIKTYTEDLQIAKSLINRDALVTRKYFYHQCYPLFKSIFDNYYTDCENCKESIDEIYLLVLSPSKATGKCQMENFKGESSLASWLKAACLYYCYRQFGIKEKLPKREPLLESSSGDFDDAGDRFDAIYGSVDIDFTGINREDALALLKLMPNKRYRELIRLHYLEQKTNEETAEELGMSMENYYNKKRLAKAQYESVSRKEAHRVS